MVLAGAGQRRPDPGGEEDTMDRVEPVVGWMVVGVNVGQWFPIASAGGWDQERPATSRERAEVHLPPSRTAQLRASLGEWWTGGHRPAVSRPPTALRECPTA